MKPSVAALKEQLLRKFAAGESIRFAHLNRELLTDSKQLASADLLLMDHSSTAHGFHPAAELLPLANANEQLLENAELHRALIERYPIVAGVCGTDPFRIPEKLLHQVKELGFVGVQNSPSIGLIDGKFRTHLENSRISYDQEVAMLKLAKQLGLLTIATIFSESDAEKMNQAGVDMLIVHPGPKGLLPNYQSSGTETPLFKKVFDMIPTGAQTVVLLWKAPSWWGGPVVRPDF